jgi:hypothetical protein
LSCRTANWPKIWRFAKTATAKPGFPCRVSLANAEVGEELILVNFEHQPSNTPYHAAHAIFVREGVKQARPAAGEMPRSGATRHGPIGSD